MHMSRRFHPSAGSPRARSALRFPHFGRSRRLDDAQRRDPRYVPSLELVRGEPHQITQLALAVAKLFQMKSHDLFDEARLFGGDRSGLARSIAQSPYLHPEIAPLSLRDPAKLLGTSQ